MAAPRKVRAPGGAWSPERRPRVTLSREQILAAALHLLDSEGLAALSLRRLAADLHTGAASLYWHVRDKDELLDLALDAALGQVVVEETGRGWRADLELAARRLRAVLLAHPWTIRVMLTRWSVGPNVLGQADAVIAVLARAGFTGADLYHAYSVLLTYVTGETNQEVSWPSSAAPDLASGAAPGEPGVAPGEPGVAPAESGVAAEDEEPAMDGPGLLAALEALHGRTYPALRSVGEYLAGHDQERQFTFGLEVILDGLERKLSR